MPKKLTPGQVAALLGVSRQRVNVWLSTGRMQCTLLENGDRLVERKHAKRPKAMRPGRPPELG